jgi:Spy/CpxP family protein refolding chaperone
MMTRRVMAVAVLTMALAAMPAAAGEPGQHPGSGMPAMTGGTLDALGPVIHMLQMLDLSDQQKQQIHSLLPQAVQGNDSAEQIRAAEQQLHSAVLADVPDPQAIDAIKASLNAAHAAQLDRHIDLMMKIAQILTPEQRQQLLKMHPGGPSETK